MFSPEHFKIIFDIPEKQGIFTHSLTHRSTPLFCKNRATPLPVLRRPFSAFAI
jgi:hypothetical protein